MPPNRREAFWSERRPIRPGRLYGLRSREARYSRQSCSLLIRRDDARRLERARQPARDHSVEADLAQRGCGGLGLRVPDLRELDLVRMPALEVADLRVAHQIETPACGVGHCARSDRPPAACMPAAIP